MHIRMHTQTHAHTHIHTPARTRSHKRMHTQHRYTDMCDHIHRILEVNSYIRIKQVINITDDSDK